MPAFGVAVIVLGGLLSTMSALNATIMAASRVAFSMARDRWLPKGIAHIDPVRRTPRAAIIVTGVILIIMAVTLPIEAVGSAASLIFLLTFALVNLSVIALRRKAPEIERRYKVPLYPFTPILGIVLNVFLALYQFTFQPIAWYVTTGWVVLGLLLYFGVFEKLAADVEPQVLVPARRADEPPAEDSVMVVLHNPDFLNTLLDFAIPVAELRGRRLVAMTVVEVPQQLPIHEGMRFAHHKETLLRAAQQYGREHGVKIDTDLVIAHRVEEGIFTAAKRHRADVMVMAWKGYSNTRERIFGETADNVIRYAPCDLMMLKIEGGEFRTCLFPTAGGPNAQLAADLLNAFAKTFDLEVTTGYVVPPDAGEDQRATARNWIDKTLAHMHVDVPVKKQLIESDSVAGGLARASRDFDLVVIGAAKEPVFRKILIGEIPQKVARYSPATVLVVKRYVGPFKTLFKRILG
jgi:nucleotide-binding universal stress UspA family protein